MTVPPGRQRFSTAVVPGGTTRTPQQDARTRTGPGRSAVRQRGLLASTTGEVCCPPTGRFSCPRTWDRRHANVAVRDTRLATLGRVGRARRCPAAVTCPRGPHRELCIGFAAARVRAQSVAFRTASGLRASPACCRRRSVRNRRRGTVSRGRSGRRGTDVQQTSTEVEGQRRLPRGGPGGPHRPPDRKRSTAPTSRRPCQRSLRSGR